MRPDPVVAAPNPLKARFITIGVGGQRCFHRCPAQRLARELLRSRVDLARPHRVPGLFEHSYHGLEYRAHLGGNRARLTGIDQSFTEQFVVERA